MKYGRLLAVALLALVALLLSVPGSEGAHMSPTVIATIPVGTGPNGVGVNLTTNRIYVSNTISNDISVIDGATNAVIATVPVGTSPSGVDVNPITNKIYVANGTSNTISVIDGANNTVVKTISTLPAQQLQDVAVNPNTNKIYVSSNDPGGRVVKINGATDTIELFIGVAANPRPIVVNPNTNKIYVGHGPFFGRTRITLLDGATNAVSDCTVVGLEHTAMGINATTDRIYVSRAGVVDTLAVIPGDCNPAISPNVPMPDQPVGVEVNPNTNRIYVANQSDGNVSVIDGALAESDPANAVVATVPVGTSPNGVGVNPSTDRVYVANTGSNTVSVIADPVIEASIDIKPGSDPNSINTKSRGVIPVAILSTPDFDAPSEVDKASLTFGRTGDEESLARCPRSPKDVTGDGLLDQVCHFRTQDTGFQVGDIEGVLRGQTVDGVPIEGRDAVRIVR